MTETTAGCRRGRTAVHIALLLLATAIVFSNTLKNDYHLDSVYRVRDNTELDRFWPPWRFFTDRRTGSTIPQIADYRPLMPLSHAIDAVIARRLGLDQLMVHHLGNIAIHASTVVLFYALFRVLLLGWSTTGRRPEALANYAFAAALLFAVHPVSGVPVNYVAGRDLLLMLLFFSASLLAYATMRRRGDTVRGWTAVLVLYALALLSKQNAVMTFAVVLMFETLLARTKLSDWRLWLRAGAFIPGILGIIAADLAKPLDMGRASFSSPQIGLSYPLTMAKAHLFYYLRNYVWPFEMRPLAQFDLVKSSLDPATLAGAAVIAASLFLAWHWRRRHPVVAFAIVTYWLLFVPTSSVLPINYVVTDYRQYPSLPFLALITVMGLGEVLRRRWSVVGVGALACYFSVSAFTLNRVWRTEESFWGQSVRYGGTALAHMNYAMSVADRHPKLAERHFLEALRLYPQHIYATLNLGLFYMRRGDREKGLALVEKAVTLAPGWAMTHYWSAQALRMVGRNDEALRELRRAADLDPRSLSYQYEAARALQVAGRVPDSLPYLTRIVDIDPAFRDTLFLLGWVHQSAGRTAPAIAAYEKFLRLQPDHIQARFNLAFALMQSGDCRNAIVQFREVLARDQGRRAAHLHLARCYESLGDKEKAKEQRAQYQHR